MAGIGQSQSGKIVWLASYPKSGNTWLRMFLYQLERLRRGVPRDANEIANIAQTSRHDVVFGPLYERFLGKPAFQASPAEIRRVRPMVQAAIAAQTPGLTFLKTHSIRATRDGVPTISPAVTAGAIYLVRDPRDVAVSLQHHIGRSLDFAVGLLNQRDAYAFGQGTNAGETWGSWSQNVASWTDRADESLLVLRYEDMLADPAAAFGAVARHLGLAPGAEALAEAIGLSSFDEMKGQEEKYGFKEKAATTKRFFVSGKSGGWRGKLAPAQVNAIVAAHRPVMKKFGYLD
jgi:hypothetical protein